MNLTGNIRTDINLVVDEVLKGLVPFVGPNERVEFEIPLGDGKIKITCLQIYGKADLQRWKNEREIQKN